MANTPYVTTSAVGNGYIYTIPISMLNATIADGDIMTDFVVNHPFKILDIRYIVTAAVTTGSKASTIKAYIDGTAVTGASLALTSATMTPVGKILSATATDVSSGGNNIAYSAGSKIVLKASSTTTFVEGSGTFLVTIQNLAN